MRIVGGKFSGRTLATPAGGDTRPTSDRVREAIFNILAHGDYPLEGARVIDLFAGTGAMGLEAISRGAAYALFVEDDANARGALRRNIEALALTGCTRTFRRDATRLGPIPAGMKPYSLAFLDPPYGRGLIEPALQGLLEGGWLEPNAALVAEVRTGEMFRAPAGLEVTAERTYGDTCLRFLALRP